jgi:hypothetical protein
MCVWETDTRAEVLVVDFSEEALHAEGLLGVPDVVDRTCFSFFWRFRKKKWDERRSALDEGGLRIEERRTLEPGSVVGEGELVDVRVGGLEAEAVVETFGGVGAVDVGHEVFVVLLDVATREELQREVGEYGTEKKKEKK